MNRSLQHGFTLIELLVVVIILGILATIGTFSFRSAKQKSNDAKRKSDLRHIALALESYYTDKGLYPTGTADGSLMGCGVGGTSLCSWGSEFSNTSVNPVTIYMEKLPQDPSSSRRYFYSSTGLIYKLYAQLENTQDPEIITTALNCGITGFLGCNYGIASTNTKP